MYLLQLPYILVETETSSKPDQIERVLLAIGILAFEESFFFCLYKGPEVGPTVSR